MGKFVRNTCLFIAFYVLINLIFYQSITKSAVYEKYIYNEKSISEYNKFLLADSHGEFLQENTNFHGIYNFSYRGETYLDMYLKLIYLSKQLTDKDTILISIDDHILSSYKENSNKIRKNIVYSNYDESVLDYPENKAHNLAYKKWLKYLPLLDVDFGTLYFEYFLAKRLVVHQFSFASLSEKKQKLRSLRRYEKQYKEQVKSRKQTHYLKKIIALSKLKKLTLIGIKFPISKPYWELIKQYDFGGAELLKKNEIAIYDFHDLFFERTELFYDQDHVNNKGAKILCKEINTRFENAALLQLD